ncbi:hypothetical protein [uncultured Ilyobacter sp.]|uniref:hypothetical protein n=1 Tax=uncultured Ilyobacter sp. TaxID=544433 RepID=UPI0029C999B9|nr:hypothetical protein [uncultured Ilyobacter sp.]
MIDVFSLILIFLENSLALDYPYNFIAIPYITYLVYKRNVDSIFLILLAAFIISFQSVSFTIAAMAGTLFYLIFHTISRTIAYEKYNLPLIVAIQILIYGSMVYLKTGYFTFQIFFKLIISYGIFNYLYMKKDDKFFGSM